MKKKKKIRKVKPLFFTVLGAMTIPLIILLGVFSYVFLRREFTMQEMYYQAQGKMAMETFAREFAIQVEDPAVLASPEELAKQIDWIKKRLDAEGMDVIDPILRSSMLGVLTGEASQDKWAIRKEHLIEMQKALDQKEQNIPFSMMINQKAQKVYGYLPFKDSTRNRMYVAVVRFKLMDFNKAIRETSRVMGVVFVFMLITALLIAFVLTLRIIRPLQAINRACREMLGGKLGNQVRVRTGDELELLAANFNRMSQALLIMTHRAEDSNPLTQLPGNREIAAEISRRLTESRKFVFFHMDIDHFKAYNDAYGLAKGDDVLRNTSLLITEVSKEFDMQEIFVGHQGGDDFVMITAPALADQIAGRVCKRFDESLKDYYTQEDLTRGYFIAADSRSASISVEAEVKRQPLMSISLAGVSNVKKDYQTFAEILERAVHVKKQAKKIPYSVHIIDE